MHSHTCRSWMTGAHSSSVGGVSFLASTHISVRQSKPCS